MNAIFHCINNIHAISSTSDSGLRFRQLLLYDQLATLSKILENYILSFWRLSYYFLKFTSYQNFKDNTVNACSLWTKVAIWWQRSGSTLAQVMACCLTVPSHYLDQSSLIISKVLWHSSEGNLTGNAHDINLQNEFENYIFKIIATSPRHKWVNGTKK